MNLGRIDQIRVFEYALPLFKPIADGVFRKGLILELRSNGRVSFGEVAPLRGVHEETLDEVTQAALQKRFDVATDLPSLGFAMESALWWLDAQSVPTPKERIPLNALIDADPRMAPKEALMAVEQGYRTIKLKVGRHTVADEIACIKQVRKLVGKQIHIRLDANAAWNLGDAVIFGQEVQKYQIEYIEEPLKNPASLGEWFAQTNVPYARDESLRAHSPATMRDEVGLAAIILKPAAMAFADVFAWEKWAKQNQKKCVMTSTFESGLGLSMLAMLSITLGLEGQALGLGTISFFKEDILSPPFRAFRGELMAEQCAKNLLQFQPHQSAHCRLLSAS